MKEAFFMNKEIIAKTLSSRGKIHSILDKKIFVSNDISKVLGCWIINLDYKVEKRGDDVYIFGSYEIQLWYACNNDQKTNVYNEIISFDEKVKMICKEELAFDNDISYKVLVEKYPYCLSMELKEDKTIELRIESSFIINEFKEAIINVECTNYREELSLEDEIIMNVNLNYLVDKSKE